MNIKTYRWFSLVAGVALIIFSFLLFTNPVSGLVAVAAFLGIALLIHGFGELSMYFTLRHDIKSVWLLVAGLISVIFGLWTLTARGTIAITIALPFIIATWILFSGILRIVSSMTMRAFCPQLATVNIVLGILGIILGIIMLHHPSIGSAIITTVVFIIFFIQGVGCIANFFWYKDWE